LISFLLIATQELPHGYVCILAAICLKQLNELLAFKQLIKLLPVDPVYTYAPHLIIVPIVNEAHARQDLARAVQIGFVADLRR
jgi:hypothetical protein